MNRLQFIFSCLGIVCASKIVSKKQAELLHGQEQIFTPQQMEVVCKIKGSDLWMAHKRTGFNKGLN